MSSGRLMIVEHFVVPVVAMGVLAQISGCATASVDQEQAAARSEAPVVAQVEQFTIPYDPSLPTYVVSVFPFDYSASGQTSGGGQGMPVGGGEAHDTVVTTVNPDGSVSTSSVVRGGVNIGLGVSKQLVSALSRVGNISIIDPEGLRKDAQGRFTCDLGPNEVGPFLIKGTVTEFSETAAASSKGKHVGLGRPGRVAGVVGIITGSNVLRNVGGGIAVADPTYDAQEMERTGVVGLDVQLMDGRNYRVLGGFPAQGTFTSVSASSGVSLFGIGENSTAFAASTLGQATRAAMNTATKSTFDQLKLKAGAS